MAESVRVIIARYREDLAWTVRLGYDCVIYDKGGDGPDNWLKLPNMGREAHTYFTHIVGNYHDLAAMNVFLQGDPFDHLDDHGRVGVDRLRQKIEEVAAKGVPFKGLAWFKLKSDRLGRPHDLREPENRGRWPGWGRDIPVGEVFEDIFDAKMPEQIICRAPTGNFCVSGERIRTRPLDFYRYCLRLTEQDPRDEGNTGHAFERLWQHIFNGNTAWNRAAYKV